MIYKKKKKKIIKQIKIHADRPRINCNGNEIKSLF